MKKVSLVLFGVAALACVVVFTTSTFRHVTAQQAAPIFVKRIPPGYLDWKVVSVAHEAGDLNDIPAILGNDIAIKAYRQRRNHEFFTIVHGQRLEKVCHDGWLG